MANLQQLILNQRLAGFPDLKGGRLAAFLPISDRLLNEIIAAELPANAPVSGVSLQSMPGNQIAIRARLARAPMLPPIKLTFTIVQQPVMRGNPVLVLKLGSSPLNMLAGPALKLVDVLPPGIRADGDRVSVDLFELLARREMEWVLGHVVDLEVTTEAGAVLVRANVQV